jgi:hypothetical protein
MYELLVISMETGAMNGVKHIHANVRETNSDKPAGLDVFSRFGRVCV